MTADGQTKNIEKTAPPASDLNSGSVGGVDWGPLSQITGCRPLVSKYGLARYSPLEWKSANKNLTSDIPSVTLLDHESKSILAKISSACDKEQSENTFRLRSRAADIGAKNVLVCRYAEDLKKEVEHVAQYKLRLRKALENLRIVEDINAECREIRKSRFVEDLVRDKVEEELFQEMGLCQEIRQLYMATLNEFEVNFKAVKGCYQEIHSLWSDQKETLELETENIGLKSSSNQISFVQGIARFDENMSSAEIWDTYMNEILTSVKNTIDGSQALRKKINSPILSDSVRDLKRQEDKVLKAFLICIEEKTCARQKLEAELDQVLKEIAHAEGLYSRLDKLGRQIDFNLKVLQTRIENRRHRPGAENCRDAPQIGLLQELKVISERVSSLQAQMKKIDEALKKLYAARKKIERQIHVNRHSLALDQEKCMKYRNKFPNVDYLMGY